MADKTSKGLADIIAASTALSDIDGRAGLLFYRGYDIHQLAGAATFEEIAYLLQRGHPPSRAELTGYAQEIAAGRALGPLVTDCLPDVAARQSPMEAMRSLVSLASAGDPDASSNSAGSTSTGQSRSSSTLISRSTMPPSVVASSSLQAGMRWRKSTTTEFSGWRREKASSWWVSLAPVAVAISIASSARTSF